MATEGVKGLRQLVNNAASSSPLTTATQLPATVPAETSPVTVLLTHHQTALMDEIAAAIRRNTGAVDSVLAAVMAIRKVRNSRIHEQHHCDTTRRTARAD
jgi:hypothetical protein